MTGEQTRRTGWLRHPSMRIGAIASLLFLLLGFVSIVWVPYPIESINVGGAMQDPSAAHWLGTDHLGRDMLSMVMKGTLTSFVVAAIAVAIGALIGVPLGLAAAGWGGGAEWAILRVNDFLFAFPALIIAILITTIFGPSAINAMVAVGIFNIPVFARVARGGALSLKTLDYLGAARLAGMGTLEIARRHVLPNIASLIIVQATIQLALGILAEASLSYVGLGTQPPATSLGLMLKDAQTYALLKPSLALIPGLTIILIVVALNLAGDGLRDQLDPKLRRLGGARGVA
ncbi:MAG TPA: ABC transporter permease [Devosia sp.]|jgi:peptide/nickel transport system permease protein|nr:ABC transporter permease [Devosia sp.]